MKKETTAQGRMSRRELLVHAGRYTLGAAAAGAILPGSEALATVAGPERWPWPYVKLDPVTTAERAYEEWYRVFCGAAIVSAVFGQLREKVGEPYRSFPIDAFTFLEGGVSGWGTICGANAGACIVTNVILGPRSAGSELGMLMGSELMQRYATTAMPTYVPRNPRVKAEPPKTVADSPLCHVSVGRWMKAANRELASPERRDRCARVTASMAHELVTVLNAWKDGQYRTKGEIPAKAYGIQAQHDCNDCHGTDVPSPPSRSPKKP